MILGVTTRFFARHTLWGSTPDEAPDGPHSHEYRLEVQVAGTKLDGRAYLVDIVALQAGIAEVVADFSECDLNTLHAFAETNPSLERFAQVLGRGLCSKLGDRWPGVQLHALRLWEDVDTWVGLSFEDGDLS